MARIPDLRPEQLSERQRTLAAQLGASRGGGLATNGPWGLLLRSEELCALAGQFGTYLRDHTRVPRRLSELAIIVVARFWSASFEWAAHAPQAKAAGISEPIIEAIRTNNPPPITAADERAVYVFMIELLQQHRVSDATYKSVVDLLDEAGAIELTTIAGFYAAIAMLIQAFEVDPLGGQLNPF